MKLSILTVITDKDKAYNDLLVGSIRKTISLDESDYEIIVYDNNHVIQQLSYAHATGLTEGYKKTKGEIVLILDSDTYFFAKDWDKELIQHFNSSEDIVFCSAIRCEDYEMPFFYRSHFLAIRSSFYKNLIINQRGFFPETSNGKMINDMSHKITKYCIDSSRQYVHYKNSNDDGLSKFYGNSGETVYNSEGEPFFHHIGRGSQKPERLSSWREFWSSAKQEK
jgi:hypothetical protein